MKYLKRVLILTLLFSLNLKAQNTPVKRNTQLFSPLNIPNVQTPYRTQAGEPSPKYWQNRADYTIAVSLDDVNHTVSGTVDIHYTNNSPNTLDYLWLQLDQNKFNPNSRGAAILGSRRRTLCWQS